MSGLPFGFDKPEDSPGFMLWQTTMSWQRLIKKVLEPYDISHPQFVIMATLLWFEAHHHDATQVLIANWTKLDKMTVSTSLKHLVAQQLVRRIEHGTDTRAKIATLTPKGKQLLNTLVPLIEATDAQFFNTLSKTKQKTLIQLLKELL